MITQKTPYHILQNPEGRLCFPHGIAFSPDGCFLAITQFGPIHTNEEGDIFWEHDLVPSASKITLYFLSFSSSMSS